MIKKHIVFIVCSVIFVSLFALPATVIAQEQTMTREERIKTLELLKMEDSKWENAATGQTMKELQLEIEKWNCLRYLFFWMLYQKMQQ